MKQIVLFFIFLIVVSSTLNAQHHEHLPNSFSLTINEHGLAKSSSSFHTNYLLRDDFKMIYTYNYNGSMGTNFKNDDAEKKFAHREQFALFHFLEDNKTTFEHAIPKLEGESTDRIIEVMLTYTYNNVQTTWELNGEKELVEAQEAYKKILELEALVVELARLEK